MFQMGLFYTKRYIFLGRLFAPVPPVPPVSPVPHVPPGIVSVVEQGDLCMLDLYCVERLKTCWTNHKERKSSDVTAPLPAPQPTETP